MLSWDFCSGNIYNVLGQQKITSQSLFRSIENGQLTMDNFIRDAVPKPLLGELFEKSPPKTSQKLLMRIALGFV